MLAIKTQTAIIFKDIHEYGIAVIKIYFMVHDFLSEERRRYFCWKASQIVTSLHATYIYCEGVSSTGGWSENIYPIKLARADGSLFSEAVATHATIY